jgi:adenylyltransferase/sulfurtransferase
MLTEQERLRYRKQLALAEWDEACQEKLRQAHILVVGLGGLGVAVLPYLVAAGIGEITLVDGDVVEESNLARQVIYTEKAIGLTKVSEAQSFAEGLHSSVKIHTIPEHLSAHNASQLIQGVDLVVDCTDNFAARYLINDVCVALEKPFVYAAIHAWEGLLSVCNAWLADGRRTATYRCLFPEEPGKMEIPTCDEVGVLGFLPGVMGILQAKEAILYLAGFSSPCQGGLLRWDARDMSMRTFAIARTEEADQAALVSDLVLQHVPSDLGPEEAHEMIRQGKAYVLDVREGYELDLAALEGAIHIPMGEIPVRLMELPTSLPCLVMCHHGMRSAQVIRYLNQANPGTWINLTGGIDAWSRLVDPDVPRY